MHYGDNYNFIAFDAEVDAKWKSIENRPVSLTVNDRIYQRRLSKCSTDLHELIEKFEKFLVELILLTLIPSSGRTKVVFGFGAKPNCVIHNALRISAITSSTGRP